MFPTFSPKNPPIPSHPQPSPSHGPAAVGTAGPGLRGGLLGHATPGGELAGAEATAGGGEVGRNSHAGAMAGRMGVGWCLGLGLVVGEGNINGNIWKYMEILRWTFVNL